MLVLKRNAVYRWLVLFNGLLTTDDSKEVMRLMNRAPTSKQFQTFFKKLGARPENLNKVLKWELTLHTNDARATAMRALWGHRFQTLYKQMLPRYIEDSERAFGELPKVGDRKTSGALHFFGFMSAYAFGGMAREVFIAQVGQRMENGFFWSHGHKELRTTWHTKRPAFISPDLPGYLAGVFGDWSGVPWEPAQSDVHDELDDTN